MNGGFGLCIFYDESNALILFVTLYSFSDKLCATGSKALLWCNKCNDIGNPGISTLASFSELYNRGTLLNHIGI